MSPLRLWGSWSRGAGLYWIMLMVLVCSSWCCQRLAQRAAGEPEVGTQSPRSAGNSAVVFGVQFATRSIVGCGEEQPSI